MSTGNKQRRASGSDSCLSLTGNDVSEMMLPPFLKNDHRSKPELIEHSFRLQRLSDHKTSYNLKIKWCESQPSKAEFDHNINMSIKDIQRTHRIGRSASAPMLNARTAAKPEPQYISIGDAAERQKSSKVVARAIAQVRRDGHIVRMLFRDEHSPSATLQDVVNAVIAQLDAVGTRPDVYVLSKNAHVARPNTTFRYDSIPNWRVSELVADPSKELHVAVDFSYELAKVK